MTPYELKRLYEKKNPNGHFFDRKTMKFFGDTMRNFGLLSVEKDGVELWCLYRKCPVLYGLKDRHYFTKEGLEYHAPL